MSLVDCGIARVFIRATDISSWAGVHIVGRDRLTIHMNSTLDAALLILTDVAKKSVEDGRAGPRLAGR